MAKQTYLELTNRILGRINQSEIANVTTATGHSLIITDLINEAQNELFTDANWYSLYTARSFNTVADTATSAVASDFGRGISLQDTTNNRLLIEDVFKAFDEQDPNADMTGPPTHYAYQNGYYRFYPVPAGVYAMTDRYWKQPTALSTNSSTSDLPVECENAIIHYAWYKILQYLNKFEQADRIRIEYEKTLNKAIKMNDKMLDKMHVMQRSGFYQGIEPPRWPSGYGM